ncbi:MAG: sulfatase [Verrucomicrobiota bacterium]
MKTTNTLLALMFTLSPAIAEDRPNVLLLMIDDLKPMTRDYGHDHMETPNFDRLAKEGVRFENAYCQVPTCGASRASMMTSLYPTRQRFPDFLTRAELDAPNQATLPQLFKEAGYSTISNGKVFHHQDDTNERSWTEPAWRPETSGITFYNEETESFMETVTEMRTPKGAKKPRKKVPMFEQGKVEPLESHDGRIAQKTMEDMERLSKDEKPFFIACGFAKPHMPFFSPKATWNPYALDDIAIASHRERPVPGPLSLRVVREQFAYLPMSHDLSERLEYNSDSYHRHMRQGYYASVTHADDLMGRIFARMDALGLSENTVVVVVGDHGWLLGEHNEWAKNQLLHEALRTAMWMKGPGVSSGGAVESFVEFVDLLPTLCEMAEIEIDENDIHGRSFVPVLRKPDTQHRDHAYTRFETGDAISSKDHFYVRWNSKEHGRETLLIDRKKDPHGITNMGNDPSYTKAALELESKVKAKVRASTSLPVSPEVEGRPIEMTATLKGSNLNGVVMSQGGFRFGYSLHLVEGRPTLSVRNEGDLFELSADEPVKGTVELFAKVGPKKLTLTVNGKRATGETSRLLNGQPVGKFSFNVAANARGLFGGDGIASDHGIQGGA